MSTVSPAPDGLRADDLPRQPLVQAAPTAAIALQAATQWLHRAAVPDAPRDARRLLALALGRDPGALPLYISEPLAAPDAMRFDALLRRRLRREPISHIAGTRYFMNRQLQVTADVLDPRPETETLILLARQQPFARVLDLGVGSGAILCTLLADARGTATGVGVDSSAQACAVALSNAVSFGVAAAADIFVSDWFEAVEGRFDLIVSNPPYIAAREMDDLAPEVRLWEPRQALTDGGDGLGAYRRIAQGLPRHMTPGGRFLCEIGPTQAADVSALLSAVGLCDLQVHADLDGRDRVISARLPADTR